jgi:RNA polymerase sigma-70 factor (ECF subfamily)
MSADPREAGPGSFPQTRWTLIRSAQASPESRRAALEALLRTYWRPLYVFMRRQGLDAEAAGDAVQDLLIRLLEHDFLERLSPEKGRLRGYLLTAARNHLTHRHERESAARRGSGAVPVPLDMELAERLAAQDAHGPDDAFEREWASSVMERALERLKAEFDSGERKGPFALVLQFFRPGEPPSYQEAAAAHGMSLPQLKAFLHRARVRYRELVRLEVADTVGGPEEAEAELAELLRVLQR